MRTNRVIGLPFSKIKLRAKDMEQGQFFSYVDSNNPDNIYIRGDELRAVNLRTGNIYDITNSQSEVIPLPAGTTISFMAG